MRTLMRFLLAEWIAVRLAAAALTLEMTIRRRQQHGAPCHEFGKREFDGGWTASAPMWRRAARADRR